MRTRIKYCGFTNVEDIRCASELGVDAVGFVLWSQSRRSITLERLIELSAQVPPFITRVGLFVDPSDKEVADAIPYLDLVQFHGNETPEFCARHGIPWIKALRMHETIDLYHEAARYGAAQGLLLDAYHPSLPGGTGQSFDWDRVPHDLSIPIILAGGLNETNVAAAIRKVSPYAVDVSGGIESSPGQKSGERMKAFTHAVNEADKEQSLNGCDF